MGFMDTVKGWFGSSKDTDEGMAGKSDTYVDRAQDFASDAGAAVKETSQDAYDSAKDKMSDMTEGAGDAMEKASDAVSDTAGDAMDAAEDVADDVKDQLS